MPDFKLDSKEIRLSLKQPFGIARGTKSEVRNVFVRLQADGTEGFGEAGPNSRYDEDADKVIGYIEELPADFFNSIAAEKQLVEQLDQYEVSRKQSVHAARAAVEMAWLDWHAKRQGVSLWKLWGISSGQGPQTSYTIGLDEIEVMRQKVKDAAEYPILKVKLGTNRDKEIIKAIRKETDKPIRVDANEGWETIGAAEKMIRFLADHNIELVEQPLPSSMNDEMPTLKQRSPLPLAADESFMGSESLEEIARGFDIINIKLMKIGSMLKARKVMQEAKKLDLKVMIGCMIESSLANTAGAILALDAEYADLDGHLLIKDDPAKGLWLDERKQIHVPDRPGLGVDVQYSNS